jgi:hypothetical protein
MKNKLIILFAICVVSYFAGIVTLKLLFKKSQQNIYGVISQMTEYQNEVFDRALAEADYFSKDTNLAVRGMLAYVTTYTDKLNQTADPEIKKYYISRLYIANGRLAKLFKQRGDDKNEEKHIQIALDLLSNENGYGAKPTQDLLMWKIDSLDRACMDGD